MFNTYHAGNTIQNIKINAVTGAILKNHPKSWFERFHLTRKNLSAIAGRFLLQKLVVYNFYQSNFLNFLSIAIYCIFPSMNRS